MSSALWPAGVNEVGYPQPNPSLQRTATRASAGRVRCIRNR
jgi:hypothetical protein